MAGIKEYCIIKGSMNRTVDEIANFCDLDVRKQMKEIGLETIPTDNDRFLSEMIVEAYNGIKKKPDLIFIAHSLPFIRKNREEIEGLDDVPVYYISGLPCVIMHKAVEMACKLIDSKKYSNILVIGADKAYSDRERVFFNTIMGDTVVALLISSNTDSHQIVKSVISTTVIAPDGENSNDDNISRFRNANPTMMRNAIMKCQEDAGVEADYYITHTSNRKFWDNLSVLMKIPREKFVDDNIKNTGHLNSHDSFNHYLYYFEKEKLKKGQNIMLINPGFGGSQGCTLIRV